MNMTKAKHGQDIDETTDLQIEEKTNEMKHICNSYNYELENKQCIWKLSSPGPKPLVPKPPRPNPNQVPINSKTQLNPKGNGADNKIL